MEDPGWEIFVDGQFHPFRLAKTLLRDLCGHLIDPDNVSWFFLFRPKRREYPGYYFES